MFKKIKDEVENEEKEYFLQNLIVVDEETKKDIALEVVRVGTLEKLYWFSLALSAFIATLGLLQNSIPVVIGVMLIAPLLRPIQSFSFAVINAQYKATWKAFKQLFWSVILVVLISALITLIVPAQLETTEVLARTNPNILDFFIAAASAVIAFLSLIYKEKLSASIAGVAMAASLLPPLSVIGIELMYQHYFLAWGSFLLFLTNIVAIVMTGILLFFIFGFKPHQDEDKEKFKINMIILLFVLSIISLPLFVSIISLSRQVSQENFIRGYGENLWGKDLKLSSIEVKNIYGRKKTFIVLEGKFFGDNMKNLKKSVDKLEGKLNEEFDIESSVELNLIQMVKVK